MDTYPRTFWAALLYFEDPQQTYWQKHPHWPKWLVYTGWWVRNPFPGITEFYLGLTPPCVAFRGGVVWKAGNWNPKGGFLRLSIVDVKERRRPFLSYRGKLIEGYLGWKPSGSFGIALRKANAHPETGPHQT